VVGVLDLDVVQVVVQCVLDFSRVGDVVSHCD
jgi:hypothetical protein